MTYLLINIFFSLFFFWKPCKKTLRRFDSRGDSFPCAWILCRVMDYQKITPFFEKIKNKGIKAQ